MKEETAAVEQAIVDANNQLTDVNTQLRIASPNSQQLLPQSAKADAVIKSLAPGETFVMPVLSSAEGWTFVVRDGKITVYPIAKGQGAIGEYVSKIRRSIMPANDASSPPPFDVASSRELYDTVFAEAGKDMSGSSSVVVAPNGPLLSVPLEILLTGPTDAANLAGAPWLFRQYKVTHVPSANNFVGLRRVAPNSQASKAWFGFGGFQPSTIVQANAKFPAAQCGGDARAFAGLDPLQGARKELQAAKALYAGAAGSGGIGELVGPEFTSEQVLRAPLKDYQVLHFAAHGLLPTDLVCQTEAAIVTSPLPGAKDAGGALLNASQIATLDLDANLVILSACNSGGPGGKAEGEALTGLALSFFSAGARSLLVTHWSVNDRVTAYLVANLVQKMNTKRAEGVTGALREVALEMLDKAGKDLPAEIQHPFYWAPFAVIGDGLERVSAQPLRTASR